MARFEKLFGRFLAFVYHCFDRIVIQGHLPLLTRPEHIVHFFRDVHGIDPIPKDALAQRTQEYQQWVEAFARNHRIPIEWPDAEALKTKKLKKEDDVRPDGARMQRQRSRYTHDSFSIRDEVLGPFVMCVGSFLPFQTTSSLNGHHFITGELERQGVRFRRDDNAFLWTADPRALQAAADRLSAEVIRTRLDDWTRVVGPKFSREDLRQPPQGSRPE